MTQTPDYHGKQAQVLVRLAGMTRDGDTAKALFRLAAEHVRLADEATGSVPVLRPVSSREK